MKEWLFHEWMHIEFWRFLGAGAMILLLWPMNRFILFLFGKKARQLAQQTKSEYDDRLVEVLIPVLRNILYILVYYIVFQIIPLHGKAERYFTLVLHLLIGLNIAFFVWRLIDIVTFYLLSLANDPEIDFDEQFVYAVSKILRFLLVIISAVVIAGNMGYNVSGLIAGLGIGGLAVALAAQDTLANIFGSITLLADKPFKYKQFIRASGYQGTVEKIGLRSTRIRTLEGFLVSVPNKNLTNMPIENISERPNIRFLSTLQVTYETSSEQLRLVIETVKTILQNTPLVQPDYRVHFKEFGSFSLDILLLYWVATQDYWAAIEASEKVNFAIKTAFEEKGIVFAYPTQTIKMEKV